MARQITKPSLVAVNERDESAEPEMRSENNEEPKDTDVTEAQDTDALDVKVVSTTPAPTGKYRLLSGVRLDGKVVEAGTVLDDLNPQDLAALMAQGAVEVIEKPVYVIAKNAVPLSFLPTEGKYRALANLRYGDEGTLADAGSIVFLNVDEARSLAAQRVIEPVK